MKDDDIQKIRQRVAGYDHLITHIMNGACVPGYKIGIIPDYYDLPTFTDEQCLKLAMIDPQLNKLTLRSKIAVRRKIETDWETAQRMNTLTRFERDNYDE